MIILYLFLAIIILLNDCSILLILILPDSTALKIELIASSVSRGNKMMVMPSLWFYAEWSYMYYLIRIHFRDFLFELYVRKHFYVVNRTKEHQCMLNNVQISLISEYLSHDK